MILMVAGVGVDLMRYERDRTTLQYTLDRAVLAAADLDQTQDPESVVQDYFDKSGLSDKLTSVTVEQGLGFRSVSATAETRIETQFMHMTGVDYLDAPAGGTAEERIDGVEISLVLDVSGSMNNNNRLPNLKVAAKDFVDNMMDNSEDGKLSISIVPYATQVSVPENFLDEFNVTDEHSYSNCVNFEANDFYTTAIDTNQELERTMHFDVWRDFDGRDNDPVELVQSPICEDDPAREMMIVQKDRAKLKNFIDGFDGGGNTSIDIGMKWGAALIDPSLQGVVGEMIAQGDVDPVFASRPGNYTDANTLKVVVLMTDGQNTSQYFIEPEYRSGDSNLWWNEEQEIYSVFNPGNGYYYWPHNNKWADHPYGQDGMGCIWSGSWDCQDRTVDGEAARLSYPDLWAFTSLQRNVRHNYLPWMNDDAAWNEWYYGVYDYVNYVTKDARTKNICDTVKGQDVIVFTIGFEAPSRGQSVLRDCASSPSHYFDVQGLEISDAFAAIASSIRQLRLTQ